MSTPEHGNVPTLDEARPAVSTITQEFLDKLRQIGGALGDGQNLKDLLGPRRYLPKKYRRVSTPPPGWESFLENLTPGQRSQLSFAINQALFNNYQTVGEIRQASYKDLVDPDPDSVHYRTGHRIGKVLGVILKRGFMPPESEE